MQRSSSATTPSGEVLRASCCLLILAFLWAAPAGAHEKRLLAEIPDEDVEEFDNVGNFTSPRVRELAGRTERASSKPIEGRRAKPRATEVPGPQLPLADIDPSVVPDPSEAARRKVLLLPRDPAARKRVLEPPALGRPEYEDPLVKRVFPSLVRSEYASDVDCLGCHSDKKDDWRRSIYGLIHYDRAIPPERRGCEGCHGPGAEHVKQGGEAEWIVNPRKLDPRGITKVCMSCHAEERLIRRQAWHFTDHHESQVTCLDCHSVHAPRAEKALVDEPNRMCLRCHADQASYFTMRSHHPVKEEKPGGLQSLIGGKVRCIDCHQAYSARNPRQLRGDRNEACLSCHQEFRGPFLFQHGGGNELLSDGCATCHIGHGSPNRYLLKRPDRSLCLTCHTDRFDHFPGPSCFSTGGCHNDIHGSNSNRLFIGGGGGAALPFRIDPAESTR